MKDQPVSQRPVKPKAIYFDLGEIVVTVAARNAMSMWITPIESLWFAHLFGEWGEVTDSQREANSQAIRAGHGEA